MKLLKRKGNTDGTGKETGWINEETWIDDKILYRFSEQVSLTHACLK